MFGEITFGASEYENEYTYNGESYNPNIKSQYLRARYYCVVTADFLTEDSYLGNIREPLTLNRYNYCVGNPANYADPSGNKIFKDMWDGLRKWLFGDPDAPKPVYLNPQPITTPAPEPEPWLLPTLEEEYSYLQEYGGGILPAGGIGYINQALGRQFSEMCDQYLEQQIANAEENSKNELCEPEEYRWKEVEEYIANHGIGVINVPNREKQVEFLNSILFGAVKEWLDMGVPWQVTMAQAAQETGWGGSAIVDIYTGENSNNLFGMKYSESAGNSQDYVLAWTSENISKSELKYWEKEQKKWAMNGETIKVEKEYENGSIKIKVIQPFRMFESVNDSIMEHSKLLVNSDYYKDALQYKDDPYRYIEEIAEYYATDPNYADSISSIIRKYLSWDGKE